MNDDDVVLLSFLFGFATGIGACLWVLVYYIAQKRRDSALRPLPINQPVAVLSPLAALRATGKQSWQKPNPPPDSSWKS